MAWPALCHTQLSSPTQDLLPESLLNSPSLTVCKQPPPPPARQAPRIPKGLGLSRRTVESPLAASILKTQGRHPGHALGDFVERSEKI